MFSIYSLTSAHHTSASLSVRDTMRLAQMSFDCCGNGEAAGKTFADGLENVSRIPRAIYDSFLHDIGHFTYGYCWLFLVVAVPLLMALRMLGRVHVTPPRDVRLEE